MLVSAPVLLALLSGFIVMSYHIIAGLWINYNTYESLICLAQKSPVAYCEKKFTNKILKVLKFGELEKFTIYAHSYAFEAKVRFKLNSVLSWNKSISLKRPLEN